MKYHEVHLGTIRGQRPADIICMLAFNELGLDASKLPISSEGTTFTYLITAKKAAKKADITKSCIPYIKAFMGGVHATLVACDMIRWVDYDVSDLGRVRKHETGLWLTV